MPFEKGNKLGSGRPKGSTNKVPTEIKEEVSLIIATLTKCIIKDLPSLEALPLKEKIRILDALLNYVLPKQKSVEVVQEEETEEKTLKVVFV